MSERNEQPNDTKGKKMSASQAADNAGQKKYSQFNKEAMRNPWVLGWLGLLATFVLMNFVFIGIAFYSGPGLVTEDYYEQGRNYEDNVVKMIEARNNLRWETNLQVPREIFVDKTEVIRFNVVDSRGLPVEQADVQITAYRPSDASADFIVKLDSIGPGIYQAYIGFPLKGIWDLKLKVSEGENVLEMEHRISVQSI